MNYEPTNYEPTSVLPQCGCTVAAFPPEHSDQPAAAAITSKAFESCDVWEPDSAVPPRGCKKLMWQCLKAAVGIRTQ